MHRPTRILPALMLFTILASSPAYAGVDLDVSIDLFSPPPVAIAPPPLPVYVVPPSPAEEYAWQPGNWRWDGYEYFWVPGTWVAAPTQNVLWTPGYWGWNGYAYGWHEGYWGPHVGYYGGINYGGGYDGTRFVGGHWDRGHYEQNPAVINVRIASNNYVSFNGGPGGVTAQETDQQRVAEHEHHFEQTREQMDHARAAAADPQFRTSNNHGKPLVAAAARPGDFTHGVIAADRAGPKNVAASEHNAEVRKDPQLAHDAALPKHHEQPANAVATPAAKANAETVKPHAEQVRPETAAEHPQRAAEQEQQKAKQAPQPHPVREQPAQPHEHPAEEHREEHHDAHDHDAPGDQNR